MLLCIFLSAGFKLLIHLRFIMSPLLSRGYFPSEEVWLYWCPRHANEWIYGLYHFLATDMYKIKNRRPIFNPKASGALLLSFYWSSLARIKIKTGQERILCIILIPCVSLACPMSLSSGTSPKHVLSWVCITR